MTANTKVGRPSDYNPETTEYICNEIAEGRSLRSICREDGMPSAGTVCRWLAEHKEFQEQYAHAREAQGEVHADGIVEIADNATPETVAQDKLRIDARKWVASKLKPKKYGDKVQQEVSGSIGVETIERRIVKADN